jgi:copper(I)-binding protein
MTVRNAGGRDELVGASAEPQQTIVELHDMRDRRMVKVPQLAVPRHAALELKPGGRHIMLFNMPRAIGAGSEITLLLRFEKSGEVRVPVKFGAPIRR